MLQGTSVDEEGFIPPKEFILYYGIQTGKQLTGNNDVVEFFKCHIRNRDTSFSFSLSCIHPLPPIQGEREWRMKRMESLMGIYITEMVYKYLMWTYLNLGNTQFHNVLKCS